MGFQRYGVKSMKKILIVCGLMIFGVSLAMPQGTVGSLLFLLGAGAAVSAVVVPFAAMIMNPISDWFLETKIGSGMGSVARFIFRIMFSFPAFALKKKKPASSSMQKSTN
jgi:hypothetical protein